MLRSCRVLVLALAMTLATPAGSSAQEAVLGSPLVNEPTAGLDCETRLRPLGGVVPFLGLPLGFLLPTPSGTPDCTWFANGVTGGGDPADPRAMSLPGDGTITKIAVRSGPTPAPIRFVVGRVRDGVCCSFVTETAFVQPTANTVTTFNVNLPVQHSTDGGVRREDFVGVSAVSDTGSPPLHGTGRHAALLALPGDPKARALYPRLSADTAGAQTPDENIGIEVLMQLTFCPAGASCTPAGPRTVGEVQGPPGSVIRDVAGPALEQPRFAPRAFRVTSGHSTGMRTGATLRFSLSERASVRIAIQRRSRGKRTKDGCRKPTRKLRRAGHCVRWVGVGLLLRRTVAAGPTAVPFTGRVGGRTLKPGRYRAVIGSTDPIGNRGRVRTPRFTIVR